MRNAYEVQLTAYHRNVFGDDRSPYAPGGHVVSRHRSETAAEEAVRRNRRKADCRCGCYVVVTTGKG